MEDKLSDFGDVGDAEMPLRRWCGKHGRVNGLTVLPCSPWKSAHRISRQNAAFVTWGTWELVDSQGILREGIELKEHLSHLVIYWFVSWLYVKLGWLIYLLRIGGLVKVIVSGCFFCMDCHRSDERTRLDDCPSSVHTPRYENTLASGTQVRLIWGIWVANPQEFKSDWIWFLAHNIWR